MQPKPPLHACIDAIVSAHSVLSLVRFPDDLWSVPSTNISEHTPASRCCDGHETRFQRGISWLPVGPDGLVARARVKKQSVVAEVR